MVGRARRNKVDMAGQSRGKNEVDAILLIFDAEKRDEGFTELGFGGVGRRASQAVNRRGN